MRLWLCADVKSPVVLCFRVKFYPSDPTQLKEEITRWLLASCSLCMLSLGSDVRSETNSN